MLLRTGMYHFEVSRTALYRVRYVLARTSTYHLVLPCTRCKGFQMSSPVNHVQPNMSVHGLMILPNPVQVVRISDGARETRTYPSWGGK